MLIGLVLLFGGVLLVRGAVVDDYPLNPLVEVFGGTALPVPGTSSEAAFVGATSGGPVVRPSPTAGPIGRTDGRHLWLTAREVASLARSVGFTGVQVPIMVAIAYRESRFDAHAVNPDPGICGPPNATGLWQICPGGAAYLDPVANAHAARAKFVASLQRGQSGYAPWGGPLPAWRGVP